MPKLECAEHDGRAFRCAHRGGSSVADEPTGYPRPHVERQISYRYRDGVLGHGWTVKLVRTDADADEVWSAYLGHLLRDEVPRQWPPVWTARGGDDGDRA